MNPQTLRNPVFTQDNITSLGSSEVFVFGSNLAGHHGGGAARVAKNKFGAINGQGTGLQGQSYAIPTMQGGVETIAPYVDEFIEFAQSQPERLFYVTPIGCGIAGFRVEDIAPLFKNVLYLNNVCLPESFVRVLNKLLATEKTNDEFTVIELSHPILEILLASDIIYGEFAEVGAMGCAGQIMFYCIVEDQLVRYRTDLANEIYTLAEQLLLSHQNTLRNDITNEVLFNYYYGGCGNHVFINKNITLEVVDNHFVYHTSNNAYHILCSVEGVFYSIADMMQMGEEFANKERQLIEPDPTSVAKDSKKSLTQSMISLFKTK